MKKSNSKDFCNIMVDLETMGNGNRAAIISIGAVRFSMDRVTNDVFYRHVNLQSSLDAGLEMDASTVLWWLRQSDEARETFTENEFAFPLPVVLQDFKEFVGAGDLVWGNGSDFDNVILENAYQLCRMTCPWDFLQNRCFRTARKLFPEIEMERKGTKHNALDDAENQARHLIKIFNQ